MQREFGYAFGADFSSVRVHGGREAGMSALALGARAYSLGRDVVFAPGEYAPDTAAGRALIAHELCHVAQDGGRSPSPNEPIRVDPPDSAGEREADQAARLVATVPPGATPRLPARQAAIHGGAAVLHRSLFSATLGGVLGAVGGAVGGALLGGLLGPVGAVVGGIIGGVAGAAAGALLGDRASRRSRSLTSAEQAYLREIYRDAVDYSRVTVTRGSGFSVVSATTLGNTINLAPTDFVGETMNLSQSGMLTLAHEMGHVWQNQNGGLAYLPSSIIAQIRAMIVNPAHATRFAERRNAAYDWRDAARRGLDWSDWNAEQQAQCMSDYNEALRYVTAHATAPAGDPTLLAARATVSLALPYVELVRGRYGAPGSSRRRPPPGAAPPGGTP